MSEIETDAQPRAQRVTGDDGANLVEYSMLIALIVVVCLSAVTFFGNAATSKMDCASDAIVSQVGGVNC
jgi:Flp pilus assembly pilin Flp